MIIIRSGEHSFPKIPIKASALWWCVTEVCFESCFESTFRTSTSCLDRLQFHFKAENELKTRIQTPKMGVLISSTAPWTLLTRRSELVFASKLKRCTQPSAFSGFQQLNQSRFSQSAQCHHAFIWICLPSFAVESTKSEVSSPGMGKVISQESNLKQSQSYSFRVFGRQLVFAGFSRIPKSVWFEYPACSLPCKSIPLSAIRNSRFVLLNHCNDIYLSLTPVLGLICIKNGNKPQLSTNPSPHRVAYLI